MTTTEVEATPRVTPYLLRVADSMCARRLGCEHRAEPGTGDPVNRARVRNAVLDGVCTWHDTGAWVAPVGLVPEEHRLVEHLWGWYERRFPQRVAGVELPAESPTPLGRRHVVLGGWVDLGVVHEAGGRELRQLTWTPWPGVADPLEDPTVRLAVLRLACLGWLDEPLLVTATNLLLGEETRRGVVAPEDLEPVAAWLDERLAVVRDRSGDGVPSPGRDCASCRFVPRCPAHDVRGAMFTRRDALVPAMLSISPSTLDTWQRCPREWRDRALLNLPASDGEGGAQHGLMLHRLLHLIHRAGSCHDPSRVEDVLLAHAADERTREEVRRHTTRCPIGAEAVGHEVEWARAHAAPPVFLATARLDAVWAHDGLLDVRDYKSGRVADHAIAHDRAARLQAWVAAPVAAARGARLRLRYEHLATEVVEDPEPWEPSEDDLEAIGAELAGTVAAMLAERDFVGVGDEAVCRRCRYRSICDDSAVPGEPEWPRRDDELPAVTTGA